MATPFALKTPFIKAIQQGGTLYVFVEAINDFTGAILPDSDYKFEFSHFVLLELPNIAKINTDPTTTYNTIDDVLNFVPNKLWWENLGETFFVHPISTTDYNKVFSEVLQGYLLNQETCMMLDPDYDDSLLPTISESVFWKTINHFGGIRLQPIDTAWANNLLSDDATNEHLNNRYYLTEFNFTPAYDPNGNYSYVVKYVGQINWVNIIRNPGASYIEFYLHIPSYVGRVPFILFESVSNQNYLPNKAYITPETNIDDLIGRAGQTNSSGLSNQAYYDVHDSSLYPNNHLVYDFDGQQWVSQDIIHTTSAFGSYQTLSNFIPASLDNKSAYRLVKKGTDTYYVMSMVDGVRMVFDLSKYRTSARTWDQFQTGTKPFTFNCALIYYDIINPQGDRATNLFGVLVFDQVQQSGTEHKIPVLLKNIDNPTDIGHSYSFRIIHTFDSDQSSDLNINIINKETNFSIDLVSDVLNRILYIQSMIDQQRQIIKNTESVIKSKSLLIDRIIQIQDKLNQLYNQVNPANISKIDLLLSRLTDLENQIKQINIDIISYIKDNSIIQSGQGINVSYNPGSIVISRDGTSYSNITKLDLNSFANQTNISFQPNMLLILDQNGPSVIPTDKIIYIDEISSSFVNNSTITIITKDKVWTNTISKIIIKRSKDDYTIYEYSISQNPELFIINIIIVDQNNNGYIVYSQPVNG